MLAKLLLLGLIGYTAAVQHFSVKDDKYCLILEADIEGELKWPAGNQTETFKWKLDQTKSTNGSCVGKSAAGLKANSIEIVFLPFDKNATSSTDQPWILTMEFEKADNGTYDVSSWSLQFQPRKGFMHSGQYKKSADASPDFGAVDKNGFKCSDIGLALDHDSVVSLKSVRAVAFASYEKDEFPAGQIYEVCRLDSRTSDIVPIVVGAALAGLVVVVLIAYLVGRARAKRQGYASV
ncbi:unnamed protein product, partial [Mesorhabditis spiculigera]